jgi:hypothetical protein
LNRGTLAVGFHQAHIEAMQLSDFLKVGNGLSDALKTVFFKMLPRGAQIQKVKAEINGSLLRKYGKLTRLDIDSAAKCISADLDLKGERECIQVRICNYQLTTGADENMVFQTGTIKVSREWLDVLINALVQKNLIPERIEVKNALHQTVLKTLLK